MNGTKGVPSTALGVAEPLAISMGDRNPRPDLVQCITSAS